MNLASYLLDVGVYNRENSNDVFIEIISVSEIKVGIGQSISEAVTKVLVRKIIGKMELGSIKLVNCWSFQITDPFRFWNHFFQLFFIHKLDNTENIKIILRFLLKDSYKRQLLDELFQ